MVDPENQQKIEVLARMCRQYEDLVEKIQKAHKMQDFDIFYNMGSYKMVVDRQQMLDEAIKHNGKKLVVEFTVRKSSKEPELRVNGGAVRGVAEPENLAPPVIPEAQDRESTRGTLYGQSFGGQSRSSVASGAIRRSPGRYIIAKKLGEGTLGSVYRADTRRGETYAVKIISKNGKHLPQEADVEYLKQLSHKQIVQYKYIVEPSDSNDIHILMEWMFSGNLKEHIECRGPLHHNLVKNFTRQILDGLDFLHSKDIIHQDLKPANLLLKLAEDAIIKIADFGSSRFASFQKRRGVQGTTVKYTEPGVSMGRQVAGRRSDIWSLGVIVIEMYTKRYPWSIEGEHPITVPSILEENPPRIVISHKMEMLNTLRDTLSSVQAELSTGVEKLRQNVTANMAAQQKVSTESINEVLNTAAGSEILQNFQTLIQQVEENGAEGGRLANLCSTRMGRCQQMCKEKAEAVMEIDNFLRDSGDFDKKMREINAQIAKLTRFCAQTEQAMTYLEALCEVSHTEGEVDLIRQQAKSAATIVQIDGDSPSMLTFPSTLRTRPEDVAKEHHEEVMLEEFLSSKNLEIP